MLLLILLEMLLEYIFFKSYLIIPQNALIATLGTIGIARIPNNITSSLF
ncbi:hypothetical protein [Methanobrevibacter arboriphilus]|nr:hypothetical protein [Methanobrevibacter arboriphilus]